MHFLFGRVYFNGEGTRVGVAGQQNKKWILLVCVAHWSGGTATASSAIQQIKLIAYLSTRHIEQRTSDIERQQINRAPSSQPIDGGASFVRHFHSSSSSSIVSAIFSLLPHMINSLSSARDRCLIIVCNKKKKNQGPRLIGAVGATTGQSQFPDFWPANLQITTSQPIKKKWKKLTRAFAGGWQSVRHRQRHLPIIDRPTHGDTEIRQPESTSFFR